MKHQSANPRRRFHLMVRNLVLLCLPSGLAVLIGACLWLWHPNAEVQLSLTSRRIAFRLAGLPQATGTIFNAISVPRFSLSGFKRIQLRPKSGLVQVADPKDFDLQSGRYPDTAWTKVNLPSMDVDSDGQATDSQVMFSPDDTQSRDTIRMDPLEVPGDSRVVIELPGEPPSPRVKPDDDEVDLLITVTPPEAGSNEEFTQIVGVPGGYVRLSTAQCGVDGSPYKDQPTTYRFALERRDPYIKIVSLKSSPPILSIQVPPSWEEALLRNGIVRIKEVSFDRETHQERHSSSSLVYGRDENSLRSPAYLNGKIDLRAPQSIVVPAADEFTLQEMMLNADHSGIHVLIGGRTGLISIITPGESKKNIRINGLDLIKQQTWLVGTIALVAWSFSTTLAGLKLLKQLKGELV